jgi:hypothetical protein
MGQKVNLIQALETAGSVLSGLERVRISSDEIALIAFTAEAERVDLHFCREPDINDYVICNGPGCLLCRIGREKVKRQLLPVYLPGARAVSVLPVSTSLRPGALWPQLAEALRGAEPCAIFVARNQGERHRVSVIPLSEDVDAGEETIKDFLVAYNAGRIALDSVYPRVADEDLARLPEIAEILKLKRVQP